MSKYKVSVSTLHHEFDDGLQVLIDHDSIHKSKSTNTHKVHQRLTELAKKRHPDWKRIVVREIAE